MGPKRELSGSNEGTRGDAHPDDRQSKPRAECIGGGADAKSGFFAGGGGMGRGRPAFAVESELDPLDGRIEGVRTDHQSLDGDIKRGWWTGVLSEESEDMTAGAFTWIPLGLAPVMETGRA